MTSGSSPSPSQAGLNTGGATCEPPQVAHRVELEAWESITVQLHGVVPASAQRGDTYMLRVLQRPGNLVMGGYTVVVVVA